MNITVPNLWVIFTTGLLTGGLTCMAVQGGLLTALIAQRQGIGLREKEKVVAIAAFLAAKLIAYTFLGLFLGWFGSFFQFSFTTQAILFVVVAFYMIGAALNMLEVHPVFRYFAVAPPRFLTRLVRAQTKNTYFIAPVTLGAATVFIPCGTTQAMMALAVASGKPWSGALILAVFVLGTSPLFFALGYSITKLKDAFQRQFRYLAAAVIIAMAVWNVNSAFILAGSTWSPADALKQAYCTITFCETPGLGAVVEARASATPTITFEASGYTLDNPYIPAGTTITLTLSNRAGRGCIQAFTIPRLGISKVVTLGQTDTVQFTAPGEPGELAFACSMGMYRGKFTVVKGSR